MGFYQSISKYYDQIFILSDEQKGFIRNLQIRKEDSILDAGCGTGDLSKFLKTLSHDVTGIDLDSEMVKLAEDKSKNIMEIKFLVLDMTEIDQKFEEKTLDFVFCMGNTLVHLESIDNIRDFIAKVYRLLKPGGKFIFQILNYGKIMSQNIKELPVIDTETIRFERFYETGSRDKIKFITKLEDKAAHKQIHNEISLYPLKFDELSTAFLLQHFSETKYFGSFKGEEYSPDSSLLIGEARK